MGKYFLNGNEVDKINKILETSKAIEILYNNLYKLEINGQKNTDKYKKQLEFLKIAIDMEQRIYKNSGFTIDKIPILIKYLLQYKFHKDYIDDEECIMNQEYNNIPVRRVFRKLLIPLTNDDGGFKTLYFDESDYYDIENLTLAKKSVRILKEVDKDIFNSYLLFLQEYIDNPKYIESKQDLIKSKYNIAFIYEKIESQMIDNNFEVNDNIYLSSKFISDLLKVELDVYNYMKDDYSEQLLDKNIKDFLDIIDLDYNNKNQFNSSIIRSCYIRACLLMMSDEKIYEVNSEFHEYAQSDEYLEKHPKDRISEKNIVKCFKKVNDDRTKVKRLSFGIK